MAAGMLAQVVAPGIVLLPFMGILVGVDVAERVIDA
jgi:hypothetical protein